MDKKTMFCFELLKSRGGKTGLLSNQCFSNGGTLYHPWAFSIGTHSGIPRNRFYVYHRQ